MNEGEIQLLASLYNNQSEGLPCDKIALEERGRVYWEYRVDWAAAYASLLDKRLIAGDHTSYRLTEAGSPVAKQCFEQKPDYFWYYYQKFYEAAYGSETHSRYCERVFGKDLTQDGMVDMEQLGAILTHLNLGPEDHVLDLGCGIGRIAEYLSDQTGARVTGLDYSEIAVSIANQRTVKKQNRLDFIHGDMNALDLPTDKFTVVLSLDTLYWVDNLESMFRTLLKSLKPSARMGIYMCQWREPDQDPGTLKAENTDLSRTLANLNLTVDTYEYTTENELFWQKVNDVVEEMQDDFENDGAGFIARQLKLEVAQDWLPVMEAGCLSRYLYIVQT